MRTVNAAEAQTVMTGSSVVSSAMLVTQDMNLLKQMWCVVYIHIWKLNQDLLLEDKKALRGRCGVVGGVGDW